jgi:hypothetical protein
MPSFPRLLLAAGLLSLSAGAIAQPAQPPKGGPDARSRRDAMHAPMKRTELKSMLEARFDKLDANHDGKLSSDDRGLARTERRDALFSKLDSNKDGAISKAEFSIAHRDGPRGPQQAGDDKGNARFSHANWRPRPMHGMMPGSAQEPISKADFVAKGLARFDKVDTDHDGIISPAERDAARTNMRDDRGRNKKPSSPAQPQG